MFMKVEILRFDDFGRGLCYVNDKVTFVLFSMPRDILEIEITKVKKNYNEAKIVKIIKPSENRVVPPCPYFGVCGGCAYQMLQYEKSILEKQNNVMNYFKKNGLLVKPYIIKNDNPYNYRNKITLKIVNKKVGYFKNNSHNIIEINNCLLACNKINEVIKLIPSLNIINGEVIIRSNYKDEILIIINTSDKIDISKIKKIKDLKGIILNNETIYKDNYFIEEVNGIKYNVTYDVFFQVNRIVCSKMFKLAQDFVSESDRVLDLYSGVGTLGLSAAKKAKEVVGVEINKNAVDNANANAKLNNLTNAKFIYSDAGRIKDLDLNFNKLIVDPPRAGLSKDTIDFIKKKLPEEIMYISCDYHTQVRDLKLLNDYEITNSYICDIFSYTYHVECIVFLHRKNGYNTQKVKQIIDN